MTARRGEVYACSLGATIGSEHRGTRPVIVVSNDAFNAALSLATVVPLTTFRRGSGAVYPSEVLIPRGSGDLRADSLALCHHIRTISRERLIRKIGVLPTDLIQAIDEALLVHLGIDLPSGWQGV